MKKQRSKRTRNKPIKQWQASGLSQAAYSRKHGIHPTTFSGWLRRVSEELPTKKITEPLVSLIPLELERPSKPESKPIKLIVGERCASVHYALLYQS